MEKHVGTPSGVAVHCASVCVCVSVKGSVSVCEAGRRCQ